MREIKNVLPNDLKNDIQFKTEDFETLDLVNSILETVFDIVIAITMFLCFFSLSSSMTANLYE